MLHRILNSAVFAGACAALAMSATASADTQTHRNLPKDGSVWLVESNGHVCKIHGSQDLSPSTCLNASLVRVENHGFTSGVAGKVYARLYYNKRSQNGGRSAYACISPGDVWQHSPGGAIVHFNQLDPPGANPTGTGLNKPIWHDVARVQWTTARCL